MLLVPIFNECAKEYKQQHPPFSPGELSADEMAALDALDLGGMKGRLCWRRDELRDLEFE